LTNKKLTGYFFEVIFIKKKHSIEMAGNCFYGLKIDEGAKAVNCRSIPFLACAVNERGETKRQIDRSVETIPVGAAADMLFFLGMINDGWDNGQSWWHDHTELREDRDDQIYIGKSIGTLEILYNDKSVDRIPLVIGVTAWFFAAWGSVQENAHEQLSDLKAGVPIGPLRQPFAARRELMEEFRKSIMLYESDEILVCAWNSPIGYAHYYLVIRPRPVKIKSITIRNNPELRGRPLISGITLAGAQSCDNLTRFEKCATDPFDMARYIESDKSYDWSKNLKCLSELFYNSESDLPRTDIRKIPLSIDACGIVFKGGPEGDWLTNVWNANLDQIDKKFDRENGMFYESAREPVFTGSETEYLAVWYGVWMGIGTWEMVPGGIYGPSCFSRSSEHFATLGLRMIDDEKRSVNYIDFCDKWLYFYRSNHDPDKGPPNESLDITRYPKGAPPHWSFGWYADHQIVGRTANEIDGDEEMDGHGATMIARWTAWRSLGEPTGDWLLLPRKDVYYKSRWDSTREAAEFVCWLMDYTGMDVIFSEGEITYYGGPNLELIPKGMAEETDPVKIRRNYANSDWYEPYPTYACLVGLECSARIAEAANEPGYAARFREYAERLKAGMLRLLRYGDFRSFMWRVPPYSIWPSFQESLAHAFLSYYTYGMDPNRWDREMTQTSKNTYRRQISQLNGYAPVQAMGYGLGWLAETALLLDEMDDSSRLLINIAKYSYDKNMEYADENRGIDWRKWQWLICEGVNLMPDGRWYKIGDLSSGAHLTALHALEIAAGVDDSDINCIKIMPRAPEPLTGLETNNFFILVPGNGYACKARMNYRFKKPGYLELECDRVLPMLSVRLGPYCESEAKRLVGAGDGPEGSVMRAEASGRYGGAEAWWIWVEGVKNTKGFVIDLN